MSQKRLDRWDGTDGLERELKKQDLELAKEDGKCFGECDSCGMETVLVEEVYLCGPCCFCQAETINGNW